jgi:ribokinase
LPIKVSLLGDTNVDILMKIRSYPQPGGDGLADFVLMQAGGSMANTAIVLARLGLQTSLFTRIGSDSWAQTVMETLRSEGVGLDRLQRDRSEPTGLVVLPVTPDGERTMFSYRGANARFDPAGVTEEALAGSRLLHLSGYAFLTPPQRDAAWKAVEIASASRISLALDLGVEPAYAMDADLPRLLNRLDLLILGEGEARAITGRAVRADAVQYFLDAGVKMLGLKLGREGCLIRTRLEEVIAPGYPVETVDSTGAGDAFSAGMLFGMAHGLGLPALGVLANALGALATTRWGASASLPTRSELRSFLAGLPRSGSAWDEPVHQLLALLKDPE